KYDELPPPHGAYPKAKDDGRSIADVGVGQWRASQQTARTGWASDIRGTVMAGSSDAGRSQIELARIGLGVGDELGDRLARKRRTHHKDRRLGEDGGDRRNAANEIEVELLVERCIDGARGARQEKCVAVGWGTPDRLGADIGPATGPVVDYKWLAEPLREPRP